MCLSAGYKANEKDGSEGIVKLDSVDSMDEVSSDGDAGGVSGAEWIDDGVVGRVDMNLKMGVAEAGGVGGFSGCNGRGDGGSGGMDSTVAICRSDNRGQREVFRNEKIVRCQDSESSVQRFGKPILRLSEKRPSSFFSLVRTSNRCDEWRRRMMKKGRFVEDRGPDETAMKKRRMPRV